MLHSVSGTAFFSPEGALLHMRKEKKQGGNVMGQSEQSRTKDQPHPAAGAFHAPRTVPEGQLRSSADIRKGKDASWIVDPYAFPEPLTPNPDDEKEVIEDFEKMDIPQTDNVEVPLPFVHACVYLLNMTFSG